MNKKLNKVPTEFAAETRFELRPASAVPFRAAQETEFERLKSKLLAEELQRASDIEFVAPLRRAANEAAALAWATEIPLLMFPALFEEKTVAAVRQTERQARIYANRQLIAA